ncbi:hypothetical protein CBR_g38875 [Chara braunii]|uniref:Uncharacterized protein n=1 Tax=Chara braunii TaxID=69332 RepID=A0A388LQX0_CHABU|nr:hypothetical protein CBR_g38875 [Chara braunii]|eukprot:GBG84592.1 hypothetical protein CBR_g38875 [Chara braunii]
MRLGWWEKDLEVEPLLVVDRLGTNVETLLHPMNDANEEEVGRANGMVDREVDLVKSSCARRPAMLRSPSVGRERERRAGQLDQLKDQRVEDVDRGVGKKYETPVEVGNMMQDEGDEAQGTDQMHMQHEKGDLEAAMERNEQHIKQRGEAVEEQPTTGVVYRRRPCPQAVQEVEAVEQEMGQQSADEEKQEQHEASEEINMAPTPTMNEVVQHDHLWKSRAGRNRKASVEKEPLAPRHGTGRPKKKKGSYGEE